jgi:hypothetical protein
MARHLYVRNEPRAYGPAWPEPLIPSAPWRLAAAVVDHAVHVDLKDPRRTVQVLRWLLDVLPEEGPVGRRMILPQAIATVEGILQGQMSKNAARHGQKLKPGHRATLAALVRRHQGALR